MTKHWMTELAEHYQTARRNYPQDELLILFDIDGTILDMRYMVKSLLHQFDELHQTQFFHNLRITDIAVHENEIEPLLNQCQILPADQTKILAWYETQAWSSEAILEAHRPFSGVLETIRWFQMQPKTTVGLNTARPNELRDDTLNSLNKLGLEYKVSFSDGLLYMRPDDWLDSAPAAKVTGIQQFQQQGYRVIAFVDNEPENLEAIADFDQDQQILLLHADTIFHSKWQQPQSRVVGGNNYNLTNLISKEALPKHTQFVWQGINDIANLGQFVRSDVHWGEFEVRADLMLPHLIQSQQAFSQRPHYQNRAWLTTLDDALARVWSSGKGIKLNLNIDSLMLDEVLRRVDAYHFPEERLWFNAHIDVLGREGFRHLSQTYPAAVVESSVDFLAPLVHNAPNRAKELLNRFDRWGVNRFSISWQTLNIRHFSAQMHEWGYEINIYDVPDLAAFLQTVLLMPQSITSTFHFPQWAYYGREMGVDWQPISELPVSENAPIFVN